MHVDCGKTIRVFLSNVTDVTAKWKLNYVAFPKKQSAGYMTQTKWEMENAEKIDDPDVFQFSVAEVITLMDFEFYIGIAERKELAFEEDSCWAMCATSSQG